MSKKNRVGDNWNEYEKLVMSKLDSHDQLFSDVLKQLQAHNEHLSDFKLDVAKSLDVHKTSCKIAEEFPKFSRDIEGIKASLNNIQKSEKDTAENTKEIGKLKVVVAQLQVKSGLWGALGGIVSLAMLVVAMWFKTDFSLIVSNILSSSK